ncbi:hypothetical protein V6N13_089922 [Hibiscus sabdariffa]
MVSSTSVGLRSNELESVGDSIHASSSQEADCTRQEDVHTINESLPQLSGCGLDIKEVSQGIENSGVGMSSMMGSGTQNEQGDAQPIGACHRDAEREEVQSRVAPQQEVRNGKSKEDVGWCPSIQLLKDDQFSSYEN